MGEWVETTLAALTRDEKIALLSGSDVWSTVAVDRVGVPAIRFTDGPNGVRGFDDQHGPTSMSYPVGAAMGATFDPELVAEVGAALGEEARAHGASVLLGPTMNIPRVPNAGRNFECFSEDPLLSGTLAAAYVRGVQSRGVAACIKHVVCNDQETERFSVDAVVDDRALREVYLEPFRIAVQGARPWAAMSAYNTVNGVTASEHPLLDEVLRGEWGFDGLVVSDWFGTYSPGVVASGLDLEMPGPARWTAPEHVEAALASGAATEQDLARKVRHLLTLVERTGGPDRRPSPTEGGLPETDAHRALARRVASESIVLLRNDGVLPLRPVRRIAVIGEHARRTPHQGGGSSGVRPHRTVSVLDGIREAVGEQVEVVWSRGCDTWRRPPLLDPGTLAHRGGSGWFAEYFPTHDMTGAAVRTEVLRRSFAGWFGQSSDDLDHERFGLRVTGTLTPAATGRHRITCDAIGRVRLRVGGDLLVDAWTDDPTTASAELELVAGRPLEVHVDYGAVPGPWRHLRIGAVPVTDEDPIAAAAHLAREADLAVVVAGLDDEWETEGEDRPDLRLPRDQDRLIASVAAAQPDTVVVLTAGAPVEVPWVDDVRAVLQAWYGGQEVGHAVADVLVGRADPGGRLPVTWPTDSRQHPGLLNFPGEAGRVRYGEGVYAGYRAYDRLGLQPRFPFGHGGSFTRMRLTDVAARTEDDAVVVRGELANVGPRDGVEVVLVHACGLGGVERRLVAFHKARVPAGERRDVEIVVAPEQLRWWDPARGAWSSARGRVELEVRTLTGVQRLEVGLPDEPRRAAHGR